MARTLAILLLSLAALPAVADVAVDTGGHVKARASLDSFPSDSVFHALTGSTAGAAESEFRFKFEADEGPWSFAAAWQVYAGYGDRIELSRETGDIGLFGAGRLQTDERRLMDLTDVIRDEGRWAALQRLDRLVVGYTGEKLTLKLGRQAISWGNGLIFSPMDIVNPFDPTMVDTEYKAGDDMLYGQLLRDNGDDLQFANVFRRDPLTGRYDPDQSTSAVKYHGLTDTAEFDLLVARHYGETTLGIGGNRSIGGAVLRGDLVVSDTPAGRLSQVVTSLSYSWVAAGRNMSGVIEYYFSGFGMRGGNYALDNVGAELAARLSRGESFTLGRHYLGGGVTIEMTPLWLLTPNLFVNAEDGSALLQVVTRNSLSDNSELLAAVNVPLGPAGTEFGGLDAGTPGLHYSANLTFFAQFAWYF